MFVVLSNQFAVSAAAKHVTRPGVGEQEGCAAAAVVATELLYGASPAWDASAALLAPPSPPAAAAPGSRLPSAGPPAPRRSPPQDLVEAGEALLDAFVSAPLLGAASAAPPPGQVALLQLPLTPCSGCLPPHADPEPLNPETRGA